MKKSIAVALVLAVVTLVSSCSTYTCPTYMKAPQQKKVHEEKI